jgi:hypothetical protein
MLVLGCVEHLAVEGGSLGEAVILGRFGVEHGEEHLPVAVSAGLVCAEDLPECWWWLLVKCTIRGGDEVRDLRSVCIWGRVTVVVRRCDRVRRGRHARHGS